MERIFKENRVGALEFSTNGEKLDARYFDNNIIENFIFNTNEISKMNLINEEPYVIKSITTKEQVIEQFNKDSKISIEFDNEHFKQRNITITDNTIQLADKIMAINKVAYFTWIVEFKGKLSLLSKTMNDCQITLDGIEIVININFAVAITLDEQKLIFSKQFKNTQESEIIFDFKFVTEKQAKPNSLTTKNENQLQSFFINNDCKKLDVVLVPFALTDNDLQLVGKENVKDYTCHLPLIEAFAKRKTNQLYIYPLYDNEICSFSTKELQDKLISLISNYAENCEVELVGLDSTVWTALDLSGNKLFNHTTLINPLVDVKVFYENNQEFIEKLYPQEWLDKQKIIDGLYDPRIKILVTPYARGYYDFIRLFEGLGKINNKEINYRLIKGTDEDDCTTVFYNNIVKM